jgi:deazaflavin-dependent oxidoreductase (nitroreductase family)
MPVTDWNAYNRQVVDEFRANEGRVGGPYQGAPMVVLHTTGARSGEERVIPLVYQPVNGSIAIFGSKAGSPKHPAWYLNLVANPSATVEVGTETYPVTARIAEGQEREDIWTRQKQLMPGFADYEAKTGGRQIPVVILERKG